MLIAVDHDVEVGGPKSPIFGDAVSAGHGLYILSDKKIPICSGALQKGNVIVS